MINYRGKDRGNEHGRDRMRMKTKKMNKKRGNSSMKTGGNEKEERENGNKDIQHTHQK